MPGSGVLPGTDGQHNPVIEAAAPGVEFAAGKPLGAPVVDAGPAQRGERDRVSPGLGQEVTAVAERMGPPVEPEHGGDRVLTQCPGGPDEPPAMLAAGESVDLGGCADRPGGKF